MPDLNDFHAFKSTQSGGGGEANLGCLDSGFAWVLVIAAVLWMIGKLSG